MLIALQIRSDNEKATTGTVLVAVGDDFESTNAAVMYQARSLVVDSRVTSGQQRTEEVALGEVKPQWYEDWYDGLGYCKCALISFRIHI